MLHPAIVPAGTTPALRAYGDEVHIHLGAAQNGGAFNLFTDFTPPGGGPPPHFHVNEDEWFFVVAGKVEFFNGETWTSVAPGGAAFLPKNSLHTFRNAGDQPLKQVIHTWPGGFETFFQKSAAEFGKGGAPDMQCLLQIAAESGIYFPTLSPADAARRGQPATPSAIVQPGQGRVLRAFGEEIEFLLEGKQSGGKFTSFVETTQTGGGPPPHFHEHEDEWFYILDGQVSFLTDGRWTETSPGDVVIVPRKSVHTFRNVGDKPSKMLIHTSPSGFENFFAAAAAEFASAGDPDMNRAVQIAAEHGIHFVQP